MKRTIRKVLCLLLLLFTVSMQTRGAVESETTAQSEKLRLDNENRYEVWKKRTRMVMNRKYKWRVCL